MKIKTVIHGDFGERYFNKIEKSLVIKNLEKYGDMGVQALAEATPKDTGKTADSWYYKIEAGEHYMTITWNNSNRNNGVPIAFILQYGHGTGTGGYVPPRDYINPAITPVYEAIAKDIRFKIIDAISN